MNSENFVASIEIYAIMYRNSLKSMSFTMPAEHLVRCIMRNALNELPHKECMALDFGCGDGRHSLYLNSLGYDVLAVDVNDSAIKLVNKRISFNKNLSNIEAVKISKSSCIANFDKHFCLIVAWEVLHWLGSISEWREALDALHKTLKHDGTLILTMPKENHFLIGTAQKLKKHEYIANEESRKNCKFVAPDLNTIKAVFSKVGFECLEQGFYQHGDKIDDWTLSNPFSMYVFLLKKM